MTAMSAKDNLHCLVDELPELPYRHFVLAQVERLGDPHRVRRVLVRVAVA